MEIDKKPPPWKLRKKDFNKQGIYTTQKRRYLLYFQYLRISPSYLMATQCQSEAELSDLLKDPEKAKQVWKTKNDMGNVYKALFRGWWLKRGLNLFGVHAEQPKTQTIARIGPVYSDFSETDVHQAYDNFYSGDYNEQGKPDSIVVSIPLSLKSTTTIKQLKQLIAEAKSQTPVTPPKTIYRLETNKLQERRLLTGLRLVLIRTARPKHELWRIAAMAKISRSHQGIQADANKKDSKNAEGRRILTIMASRLLHDTLVIAENAAMGVFPSTKPTSIDHFDALELQKILKRTHKWENERQKQLLESQKTK